MANDLRSARDRIAGQHPTGVMGHPRPPGKVASFPCYIVLDPTSIDYHSAYGPAQVVTLPIRVIVARTIEQDGTVRLDELVWTLPALLEAITPDGNYRKLAITGLTGGYQEWSQGGQVVGLAADLTATITF